jgi:hypothetical protein
MATAAEILRVLDDCCDAFTFPMLDNGYVYLAATRLSLFRAPRDWAMVIELFGFSPRAGLPDLCVSTFASTLFNRDAPERYVTTEAHEQYLRNRPNNEARYFFPIEEGEWQDAENGERLCNNTQAGVVLRKGRRAIPSAADCARHEIAVEDPNELRVFELCRYLAAVARDDVLATLDERRVSVAPGMQQLIVLDDWHHPDLANGECPSELESFQQLARVLETGDGAFYRPSRAGNTHWKNWPDGGSL